MLGLSENRKYLFLKHIPPDFVCSHYPITPKKKRSDSGTTTTMISSPRVRVLMNITAGLVVPAVPVLGWWKWSIDERQERTKFVDTKVRVPNVQTIDDLMVEKCKPGDVVLFDRRCELCAAGPIAAMACLTNRALLCIVNPDKPRKMDIGSFDHCGMFCLFVCCLRHSLLCFIKQSAFVWCL